MHVKCKTSGIHHIVMSYVYSTKLPNISRGELLICSFTENCIFQNVN